MTPNRNAWSRIHVEREAENKKQMERWIFWFYDDRRTLYLDLYDQFRRVTPKHVYHLMEHYERIGRNSTIEERQVPMPADVTKEALDKFIAGISVKKWSQL